MNTLHGLSPIVDSRARVLILGSFPSEASLQQQQYYANPRNQFWRIMESLFGIERSNPYSERCQQLLDNRIALWDVIQRCQRQGSLDSKIRNPEANNLAEFYQQYPQLAAVFWNGAAAEQHHRKLVGVDNPPNNPLTATRLPSTSPANAAISLLGKIEQWKGVRDVLP